MSQRAGQKAESKGAILREAARLLRAKGVSGMSVERAMSGAGLTVGAFYAHFAGKEELLKQAFQLALDETAEVMLSGATGPAALGELASWYLSEGHRDQPSRYGCPMPAVVASAVPDADKALRHLVVRGIKTLTERVLEIGAGELSDDGALAFVVLLVGGQVVARATRGAPLSAKVLAASRRAALAIVSDAQRSRKLHAS